MISWTEEDIERMIFNTKEDDVIDHGLTLYFHAKVFRQVNLGAYGQADLVGVTTWIDSCRKRRADITVYELKKDAIGFKTFGQAMRYVSGIRHFFQQHKNLKTVELEFTIVLIGSEIDWGNDFLYMLKECGIKAHCYKYTFEFYGLHFERIKHENYFPSSLSTAGFGKTETMDILSHYKELYKYYMKFR